VVAPRPSAHAAWISVTEVTKADTAANSMHALPASYPLDKSTTTAESPPTLSLHSVGASFFQEYPPHHDVVTVAEYFG
jgi:hypothetical protein